eukprot:Clim_evm56s251 gene=Clim_evmTU56s251
MLGFGARLASRVVKTMGLRAVPFGTQSTLQLQRHRLAPMRTLETQQRLMSHIGGSTPQALKPEHDSDSFYPKRLRPNQVQNLVSLRSTKGMRDYNHDRFVVGILDEETYFYGVFDGHGGARAADFVSSRILQRVYDLVQDGESYTDAASMAMVELDSEYLAMAEKARAEDPRLGEQYKAGTTAVTVIVRDSSEVYVSNVGDSHCILSHKGQPQRLSQDHKPNVDEEADRIEDAGGSIVFTADGAGRIFADDKTLAVSRAIGAPFFRNYGLICEPHTTATQVSAEDDCIILISDGVSDMLGDEDIVDLVNSCSSLDLTAMKLIEEANDGGAQDNMTALVVRLPGWEEGINRSKNTMVEYVIDKPFGVNVDYARMLELLEPHLPDGLTEAQVDAQFIHFHDTGHGIISEALFRMFGATDTSSTLTFANFKETMRSLNVRQTDVELNIIFRHFDVECDSVLSYPEFVHALENRLTPFSESVTEFKSGNQ